MKATRVLLALSCSGCFSPVPQFEDGVTVVTTDAGSPGDAGPSSVDAGTDAGGSGWGVRACGAQTCGGAQFCLVCPPGIDAGFPDTFECVDAGPPPYALCEFPYSGCLGLDDVDYDAGVIRCVNG